MSTLACTLSEVGECGPNGEGLEELAPLSWPGADQVDEHFIHRAMSRLQQASYHPPDFLCLFAFTSATVVKILRQAAYILGQEPNIVDVAATSNGYVRVFGDIHGDFHSLIEGLSLSALPSKENKVVFAGDYVDRGPWGVEVVLILCLLKIQKPDCIFLVRGNHESASCIERYGFAAEVKRKYGQKMLPNFMSLFKSLPLAAIVRLVPCQQEDDTSSHSSKSSKRSQPAQRRSSRLHSTGSQISTRSSKKAGNNLTPQEHRWLSDVVPGERRVLVVHGGLFRSPESFSEGKMKLGTLFDLMETSRRLNDPSGCLPEDVLWSDPMFERNGVEANPLRACGLFFGKTSLEFFLKENKLNGILRAHEGPDMRENRPGMNDMQEGFSVDFELADGFGATVFSSADYRKLLSIYYQDL